MKQIKLILTAAIFLFVFSKTANAQLRSLTQNELFNKVANVHSNSPYYKGDKPCVILFHNNSCPNAKKMESMLTQLSKRYGNRIYFYKVNVFDIDDMVMDALEIEGVPTTFFIRGNYGGEIDADDFEGLTNMETLEEYLDWLIE